MKSRVLFLFLPLLLVMRVAYTQPMGPEGERPFERIERFKKMRLIEMLDMKEEQSVRFFARLNEHDNAKRDLMKGKMELLDRVERLVRNHSDEQEFDKVFPDVAAANAKIFEEDQKFFDGLKDILSAEQRGKYLLFERHFEQELRDAMREVQKRRHRMGE